MLGERVCLEELAYKCSDAGEHVTKVIEQVNLRNTVEYRNGWLAVDRLSSTIVWWDLIEDYVASPKDSKLNNYLTDINTDTGIPLAFAELIDAKTLELAQDMVAQYEGNYDD